MGLVLRRKLVHQRRAYEAIFCLVVKDTVICLPTPLLKTHLEVKVIPPQSVKGLRGYLDHPSLVLAGIHWYGYFFNSCFKSSVIHIAKVH